MDENQESYRSLDEILRNAPRRTRVKIQTIVTNELTGEVIEDIAYEDAELWSKGYRQYYKTSRVMEIAEHVAARVAYAHDKSQED